MDKGKGGREGSKLFGRQSHLLRHGVSGSLRAAEKESARASPKKVHPPAPPPAAAAAARHVACKHNRGRQRGEGAEKLSSLLSLSSVIQRGMMSDWLRDEIALS